MEAKEVVCLFLIVVQRVSSLEESLENTQDVVADSEVDFERLENEYAVGNVSTRSKVFENTTMPRIHVVSTEIPQPKLDNVTEFRPSVHLGQIEEPRSANSNPFNKISHFKFDNFFSVRPETKDWHTAPQSDNESSYLNEKNILDNVNLTPPEPNFFPTSISNEKQFFRTQNNGAPFHTNGAPPTFHNEKLIPTGFQNSLQLTSPLQRPEFQPNSPDETYYETTYVQEIPQPFDRPGSLNEEVNFVTPFNDVQNFDYVKQASFENYEEANGPNIHSGIRDILPTRKQKFPYKFYHETSPFMDDNLEYVADEPVFHNSPRERRISPWKKILHLIGTILPFGLLLATLTPNVIQISNSTQSTIPLSKLKDVDLPPEHKSLRMIDDPSSCEEKTICEVILAGSRPRSNLLQNILWNFVMRTPEETAKDNGLRELFQAVKKRDCNFVSC